MIKVVLLLCSLLLLLPASSPTTVQAPTDNSIKIGTFLSLTGATAAYGISTLNAIKLATEEINHNGGIDGKQIELVVEDDHSNAQEVPSIVNKLIEDDKVDALIAEPVSTRAMVAARIAQKNRVVMISSASVKPELTMQGDYIFRACFISSTEGEAIAKFARNKLKASTAAIILDHRNDYAVVLGRFFDAAFVKLGGRIVKQQRYDAGDNDIAEQITSIKASKPDILFAPGFYRRRRWWREP